MLFDAPLSEGTLAGLLTDAARRLAPFMTGLAALIRASAVVCADETSCKVDKSTDWVASNKAITPSTTSLASSAPHPGYQPAE